MTAHTHDDAFHEIQLNGKQLVFLVMAATIVSVAIFLCGVLVGRNVRAERAATMQTSVALPSAEILPATPPAPVPQPQADADPRVAAPPPTVDDGDAKSADTAADVLKPAAPRPEVPMTDARPAAAATTPVATKSSEKAAKAAESAARAAAATAHSSSASITTTAAASPSTAASATTAANTAAANTGAPGSGFAVQVAALNARGEADAIAKRLSAKGYAAYVQVPTSGSVYRVRVGSFKTRREAETVAARLQKEEQFKPWVTR